MDPLLLTELSTITIIAAIPLLFIVVEPWHSGKKAGIRALFGALLAAIFLVPIGGMALLQALITALSGQLTLNWILTWEVRNGGHFYTYILIMVIFLAALYLRRDLYEAAMAGGIFISLHELVWYLIVYAQNFSVLLGKNWLTSDEAMFLWMLTIAALFIYKKYPLTKLLGYGTAAYAGFQIVRVLSIGATKDPVIEFASWLIMAGVLMGHLWIVGKKQLKAPQSQVEGYKLYQGMV